MSYEVKALQADLAEARAQIAELTRLRNHAEEAYTEWARLYGEARAQIAAKDAALRFVGFTDEEIAALAAPARETE